MSAEYRQPTVDEAVEFMLKSVTLEYRRKAIKFWREKFGDVFADSVERKIKSQWGKT